MSHMEGDLTTSVDGGLFIIRFNRPRKKNALNDTIMLGLVPALQLAAADPHTLLVVFTGTGDYFTSGNDLTNFTKKGGSALAMGDGKKGEEPGLDKMVENASNSFKKFVEAMIDFPKPLVAVVNGPAVGVGTTMLGLCDAVYASDRATFHAPFVSLGQAPEGCSSYTFPRIMGPGKATEVLLFGRKLTAEEACRAGLVTEVFPDKDLGEVWPRLQQWAQLPPNTMKNAKQLIRGHSKETLHKVNELECKALENSWTTEEFFQAIMSFFTRKSKL